MACPHDTDGDGDCGNPRCPYCGRGSQIPLHLTYARLTQLVDERVAYWREEWERQYAERQRGPT